MRRITALIAMCALIGGLAACQPAVPETPAPDKEPPTAPQPVSSGMWISKAEIAKLPTSGAAWNNLVAEANGNWGTASLSDNNATHDTSTLAGALVAVRTNNAAMAAKTRSAIMSITKINSFNRVLELSRNVPSYVIAADLVGLSSKDDATFKSFISGLRTKPLSGHSGGKSMVTTALVSPNNWGTMARAATLSIDLYVGDKAGAAQVAKAHQAWLGDNVANTLNYTSTKWHASGSKAGINRRGATINGQNVDGVIPEDQRRTGEPGGGSAAKGSYPWEALQGATVTGVLAHRAGLVDINAGDHALQRAYNWLYKTNGNPPSNDDRWQPWILNRVAGTSFAASAPTSPGKNMGWGDWSHGPHS
ncbi:MAG: hypothetical protein ABI239_11520 [Aquihabitans sp.]